MAEVLDGEATAGLDDLLFVRGSEAMFHAGETTGDGGEDIFFGIPEGDRLQQFFKGDAGLFLHGPGVGFILFADPHGIHDDKVVFGGGVRGDGFQIVGFDNSHAASFHLFEEGAGFDGAHEDDDFHRFDVGAGGDHIHGDGDARVVAVAERLDEVFGTGPGGAIGDLLGEVVALGEFFSQDFDDRFGVGIVFGKDEGLGNFGAAWEYFGKQFIPEGFDDGADLVRGDDVAVELVGVVGEVIVQLFPAGFPGFALTLFYIEPRVDC